MTFLAPLAGIIAGAITLPALTLLYFLKLRRRPVRVSSTLLWRRSVRDLQVNAPFRWIRPSWLLLLQLLAAGLLSAALGRPAIDAGAAPAERTIIVIDRSASMNAPASADDPERTRLDEARDRAREVIDRLSGGATLGGGEAQAMVIDFASSARVRQSFTSDRGRLRAAIDAIEPTDQPGDLAGALRLLEAQMLRAGASADAAGDAPPRITLFTDGGFGEARGAASARLGDADVRMVRVGPSPSAARDNVGVVALSARRDYEEPSLIRLFARLQSVASEEVEAPLTLTLDGETVGGRAITIPAARVEADGSVRAGEAAATFEVDSAAGGVLRLGVRRVDDLTADDSAALVVGSARSARVLLVTPPSPSPAASFTNRELAAALSIITEREIEPVDLGAYEALARGADALARYDLIVFSGVRPGSAPPVPTLSFGAIVPTPGLVVGDAGEGPGSTRVVAWRRTHPLLRNVGLDTLRVADPLTLRFPGEDGGGASAGEAGVTFETLARGAESPLIVSAEQGPIRRVFVAFALENSNWPALTDSFPIFLTHVIEGLGLGGAEADGRAFTTAEPITLRTSPGVERVAIEGPVTFDVESIGAEGIVTIGRLPLVGLYEAWNVVERDRLLAVNLVDPTESAIATRDALFIAGESRRAAGVGAAAPREVWPWFVLAAAAVATIEWLLFAWRMRV